LHQTYFRGSLWELDEIMHLALCHAHNKYSVQAITLYTHQLKLQKHSLCLYINSYVRFDDQSSRLRMQKSEFLPYLCACWAMWLWVNHLTLVFQTSLWNEWTEDDFCFNYLLLCQVRVCVHAKCMHNFSHVQFFATLWTLVLQASVSMGFSRQEYWSGLSCPCAGNLPNPGMEPISLTSPALEGRFFTASVTWEVLALSHTIPKHNGLNQ